MSTGDAMSSLFDGKFDPKRPRRLVKDSFNQMIVTLVMDLDAKRFNMNPPYQRGLVWAPEHKQRLINSLIAGLSLPSIYMRELPLSEEFSYEVVDGKQRLSTIQEFLHDEWAYNGKVFSKSLKDFQGVIHSTTIPVIHVKGLSDADTVELYERLNFGGVPQVKP